MTPTRYFFCGIGGSGMLPLSMLVAAAGHEVRGSDRSFDQGLAGDKRDWLAARGVRLFPQDGSGLDDPAQVLVTSTAVEAIIPDVARAREIGARHITRAELLSSLFNAKPNAVAVAGTSGKSTITAMLGWILHAAGRAPTIVNGAVLANFREEGSSFASFVAGAGEDFVAEVDESDGSIALYRPRVAILSNITIDHKPIPELMALFAAYLDRAGIVVANLDDANVRALLAGVSDRPVVTWSLHDPAATVHARRDGDGEWRVEGVAAPLSLQVFGDHNVSNALAAIAAAQALGVAPGDAVAALAQFRGVARRMEPVLAGPVSVFDDFGHNPDKIAASLCALQARHTRVLALFQPHGYRPMELMADALVDMFRATLRPGDRLWITDPVYYGGTVTRTPIVQEIVARIGAPGATHLPDRAGFPAIAAQMARPGDALVVMGARDDTLSLLARDVARAVAGAVAP